MTQRETEDTLERPPLAISTRDLDELGGQLATWWAGRTPGATDVRVTGVCTPGATGVANETVLFDVAWTQGSERLEERCVGRIAAQQMLFLETDIVTHTKIIEAVGSHSDVPVPRLLALELDASVIGAPFYVMGRIDGDIPTDEPSYNEAGWLVDATEEQRERVWRSSIETMGRLHQIDTAPLSFLRAGHPGANGLEQDLSYWRTSAVWSAGGVELPTLERAGEWLSANVPSSPVPGFAWGDSRYANMIYADHTCAAVLDWDMASLAGGEADLAWWVLFEHIESSARGLRRLPGLGSSVQTVELWEQTVGRSAESFDWYLVFAAYRVCVAVTRAASMMAAAGVMPEGSEMLTNNIGTQLLVSMLDLPPAGDQLVTWPGLV